MSLPVERYSLPLQHPKQQWGIIKCMDCGGKLKIEKDDEFERIRVCQECGSRHRLIKKGISVKDIIKKMGTKI